MQCAPQSPGSAALTAQKQCHTSVLLREAHTRPQAPPNSFNQTAPPPSSRPKPSWTNPQENGDRHNVAGLLEAHAPKTRVQCTGAPAAQPRLRRVLETYSVKANACVLTALTDQPGCSSTAPDRPQTAYSKPAAPQDTSPSRGYQGRWGLRQDGTRDVHDKPKGSTARHAGSPGIVSQAITLAKGLCSTPRRVLPAIRLEQ